MMNNEVLLYMRQNPRWYITLSRDPERMIELQEIYKQENHQTFEEKVEQFSMLLSMMEILL